MWSSFLPSVERKGWLSLYIVVILSVCLLILEISFIRQGVFYSADGGVKYLVVKQLAEGHGFKYMYLPQPAWVHSIWDKGFFPFTPPFVYPSARGYMYVFPPGFQVINSFLYSKLGDGGLYILPVLSVLLLWVGMVALFIRLKIRPARIALALFILVFASPLTVYATMYWEHLPAVLLLFAGVIFLVRTPSHAWGAIALGMVSGLSVWLRPEAILLNVLYAGAVVLLYWKERRRVYIIFLGCLFFCALSFLVFNKIEYSSFLGIHASQVLQDNNADTRLGLGKGLYNLWRINYLSVRYFLFILLLIPILYRVLRYKDRLETSTVLLLVIAIAYSLVVPFMVPNDGGRQWGARYFLPVIPIVLVALILAEKQWNVIAGHRIRGAFAVAVVLCGLYCFYRNTYKGAIKEMHWSYSERIKPDLDKIGEHQGNVVIISTPYMVYELSYLFNREYFFLARGDDSLKRLLPLLKQQGVHQYTYIYDPREPATYPKSLRDSAYLRTVAHVLHMPWNYQSVFASTTHTLP